MMARMRPAAVALSLLFVIFPATDRALAACGTGQLTPQLHEFMVNQGLPYNQAGTPLVRGKDAVVRLFLSAPECALGSDSIQVTGGSMTVLNGATLIGQGALFSPVQATAVLPFYATIPPTPDNPGDPLFTVSGSILTPCGGAAGCVDTGFTATFNATVRYVANGGAEQTATFSQTAAIAKKTNALRLLVIPMGDTGQTYRSQFSLAGEASARQGLTTLARIAPVPGTVGALCPPSPNGDCGPPAAGGIRYHLNLSGMVNLKDLTLGLNVYKNGKFCGNGSNFDGIKRQLAQFLLSWNTLHPANQADVVLGVVDEMIAADSNLGCVEGMGTVNDRVAWVRTTGDKTGVPSRTGALMGMEISHGFGVVKGSASYHSSNPRATSASTLNRAYNVDQRRFIAVNHSVMNFSNSDGPWNNDTTFLEWLDQANSLCLLNGPPTTECATPSSPVGTNENVNAGPTIVVAGTTDGTSGGTKVEESFDTNNVPLTPQAPGSPYRLVETGIGGRLVVGFPVNFPISSHNDDTQTATSQKGLFEFALADGVQADNFALYFCSPAAQPACSTNPDTPGNGGSFLYGRQHQNVTPAVLGSRSLQAGAAVNLTNAGIVEENFWPSFSPNGGWLAYEQAFIANTQYETMQTFANNGSVDALETFSTSTGALIDSCAPPSVPGYQPFALTYSGGGFLWSPINFNGGSFTTGAGVLDTMSASCKAVSEIPIGDGPGGVDPDEAGALATDGTGIWLVTYSEHFYAGNTGQIILHLNASGAILSSCAIASDAPFFGGNDTLALANLSGLGGSGKYLLTDAGGITTLSSKIYAFDVNSCTGGNLISPVTSWVKPVGMGAAWMSGDNKLYTSDGSHLYNLGGPPFTVQSTTTIAGSTPVTGLAASSFRSEIRVAPVGDASGGGVTGMPGGDGSPTFCPNGDLLFVSSTGDIYKTRPDLSTTPPIIPAPTRVYNSGGPNIAPSEITCMSDGRIVFQPDSAENNKKLYVLQTSPFSVTQVPLPASECGVSPSGGGGPGYDPRLLYRYFPCTGGFGGIAMVNIDNGVRQAIMADPQPESVGAPTFGTDGRIGYTRSYSSTEIHTINIDGTGDRLISTTASGSTGHGVAMSGPLIAYTRSAPSGTGALDVVVANTSAVGAGFDVRGQAPNELRADLVYQCSNGVSELVAVGVKPTLAGSSTATFESTFDASNACGGSPGKLKLFASDGFTRVSSSASQAVSEASVAKAPAAVVSSPPEGATYSTAGIVPLFGGGADAQDQQTPTVTWKIGAKNAGSGERVDAPPPLGGWTPGQQTVQVTVTNSHGLTDIATRSITIVDDAPPTVTVSHAANGDNGWNTNGPVSVGVSAADDGNGLGTISCTRDASPVAVTPALTVGAHSYAGSLSVSGDGTHAVSCSVTDTTGFASTPGNDSVKIDSVLPAVSVTSPVANATFMLNEAIGAGYTCSDGTSGIASCAGPVASGSQIDTATVGSKTFAVTGRDIASNTTTVTIPYRVVDDHTAPTLTVTHTVDGTNGWNRTASVAVTISAGDTELGISSLSCTVDGNSATLSPALSPNVPTYAGTFTASGQGSHTVTCTASDRGGNSINKADSVPLKIDSIAPSVTVTTPTSNATYQSGQVVNAGYSCAESIGSGGSGLASCTGSVANGSPIDTTTSGSKVFSATAKDLANNSATSIVPYVVLPACSALPELTSVYTTHPILILGPLKITTQSPKVEATLHLTSLACTTINYRLHVLSGVGGSELKVQDRAGNAALSTVSFSIDMGNGVLGQFMDPTSVCIYAESQAGQGGAQYDRIPATSCITLTEDAPGKTTKK